MPRRQQHPSEARRRERFLARAAAVWGTRPEEVARRLSGERRSSLRINPLAGRSPAAILRDLEVLTELAPIAWCPDAYHILGDKRGVPETAPHAARQGHGVNDQPPYPGTAPPPPPV